MRTLLVGVFLLSTFLSFAGERHLSFYVSRRGNDAWSGTLAAPNAAGTDGPFASLEAARNFVRSLKTEGKISAPVTVSLRGGTYQLHESFVLTAADSGSKDRPVVWRPYRGESVRLSGGRPVGGFVHVTDPLIRSRLSASARDSVVVADLRAQGITDFGKIVARGGAPMELFFRGERLTVARYPNKGWLRIADVPQSGSSMFNAGLDREKRFNGVPAGRHFGRITYDGNRPSSWRNLDDITLHGYWTFDWSDAYQGVWSIDTVLKEITLEPPFHYYGYTRNQRYYVLNVLEELDAPGEWYLDRKTGLLYCWFPSPFKDGAATVSMLEQPMVSIDSSAWIRFEGISFLYSRGTGIRITGGHNITIERCTIARIGSTAITITGGRHNGVTGSTIHDVGLGGIILSGGDRRSLVRGDHFATNNHIHDYSTWLRTGQYAVILDGVGHRIANNLIHDAPFEGVYLRGNDHLIEYNEFHHLMKETGDAGAIHTGRDLSWRGNVIRYNYFHDLRGPGLHGVMAVYLDDWASGFMVFGNLFYKAGRATLIGGGRDNRVENNIYVACSPSVHVDARGLGWASYYFDGTLPELRTKMDDMKFSEPPYSTRYPELLRTFDAEPAVPKYNRIVHNISYGGRWMDVYDFQAFDFSVVTVKDNLIGDPVILRRRKGSEKGWDPYYLNIDMNEGYETIGSGDPRAGQLFPENAFLKGNPGVMAPERGDFRLKKNSPAWKAMLASIPFSRIGLRPAHDREKPIDAMKR